MLGAFRKTGVLLFTRAAHLEGNKPDVQIGDALIAAIKMEQDSNKRHEVQTVIAQDLENHVESAPEPLRIAQIDEISALFGAKDSVDCSKTQKYGLQMCPQFDSSRKNPETWRLCLTKSPRLMSRFHHTNRDELLKFHNVGILLDENMKDLTPPQALILGFVCVCYLCMVCVCVICPSDSLTTHACMPT